MISVLGLQFHPARVRRGIRAVEPMRVDERYRPPLDAGAMNVLRHQR